MIAYPADLKRSLPRQLPGRPYLEVIARDVEERRCPAYAVDHWELVAYYTDYGHDLAELAGAFSEMPAVYLVMTYERAGDLPRWWPVAYRDIGLWRPQVRALMRPIERS
jgi:hypothetical protein